MHAHGVYQINTRVWLREMAGELDRPASLADIPDAKLDQFSTLGFDFIWLLGIWKTGAAGRKVSATNPDWRPGYEETLGADLREEDICGSPFAVQEYVVHPEFGGNDALRSLRDRLHARGLQLILDFVGNHTALDHPWVKERPELYIHGTEEDLAREPYNYCRVETGRGTQILAHGQDPHYHGWPDTLQLNYRHPALHDAMCRQLLQIAEMCDGVRCDMAMLMLPDVFAGTWGSRSQPADGTRTTDRPFWPNAIALVRQEYRDFVFIAEVYWDKEWEMQQQGFDYTYDKRLYDRLVRQDVQGVRAHLERASIDFQRKLVRFLENHDEPRAASAFPPEVHRAAAVLVFLTPGLRLFHEGQVSIPRQSRGL
jgi:glycosidase